MSRRKTLLYFLLFVTPFLYNLEWNNSCKNYLNYLNIFFSKNCYYIPDFYQSVEEIIRKHAGNCETHQVQTEDGYILSIFRIPQENPKGVILLQHPFTFDARIWVSQYNESVAFKFWKSGYDVWMGSFRGSQYSKKHTSLSPKDSIFWNFGFHEMGYYDNRAFINYIRNKTEESKIIYLGHGFGATAGIIYACTQPEEAEKSLELVINLGASVYFKYSRSNIKYLLPLVNVPRKYGIDVARVDWFSQLYQTFMIHFPFKKLLVYMHCLLFGWTPYEADPNTINLYISLSSYELPLKPAEHFAQWYSLGDRFQMFDHGQKSNLEIYNSEEPPLYLLKNITVPMLLVYSVDDTLSTGQDNKLLYKKLSKKAKSGGKIVVSGSNHLDLVFGRHRNERIYDKIIDKLEKEFISTITSFEGAT